MGITRRLLHCAVAKWSAIVTQTLSINLKLSRLSECPRVIDVLYDVSPRLVVANSKRRIMNNSDGQRSLKVTSLSQTLNLAAVKYCFVLYGHDFF
jgi:hypothetical protein